MIALTVVMANCEIRLNEFLWDLVKIPVNNSALKNFVVLTAQFYNCIVMWDLYAGSQTTFPGKVVQDPGFCQLQKVMYIS